jgi:S-adenosylmethionine-diacylglycerol 3-amino-3-carboxypropyl transferase
MNTKTLIDADVINSSTITCKSYSDRLFSYCFKRLFYTQIWEDPQADLDALQLKPGANIVTISSGGCNALAYLSANPSAVHAVDENGHHLAMLEIKKQAIKNLPDYDSVLHFLGNACQPDNIKRYQRHIRSHLPDTASTFWEGRPVLGKFGKKRFHYFSNNAYQHGLMGGFIGFCHWFVRLMGGDLQKISTARNHEEQVHFFEKYLAPVFDSWLFRVIAVHPIALYSLGIAPSQFASLKKEAKQGLPALFKERIRHLACDFPLENNCFAHQAFARCYDTGIQSALPMYLQKQYFLSLRSNIDRLYPHHTNLTEFLRQQPGGSVDAYLLLDVQDCMDKKQLTDLWIQVTRTATSNARVVFRTAGKESPLQQMLPSHLLSEWHTSQQQNSERHAADRSAIYGGMHIYEKTEIC